MAHQHYGYINHRKYLVYKCQYQNSIGQNRLHPAIPYNHHDNYLNLEANQ